MKERELARLLNKIVENDTNYNKRYILVLEALVCAKRLKYECGFRVDEDMPDWPVISIILPNIGEVSWHMPPSYIEYDGHGLSEKFDRINQYHLKHSDILL